MGSQGTWKGSRVMDLEGASTWNTRNRRGTSIQSINYRKGKSSQKEDKTSSKFSITDSTSKIPICSSSQNVNSSRGNPGDERWRVHRIAEDYVNNVSSMMFPGTYLAPFGYDPASGQYPLERITALGILTSPLRRESVIEKWSPLEIATFESSLALFGKEFHQVQKFVKSKSTKEIVEFYYIWKKTSHYKVWKKQF